MSEHIFLLVLAVILAVIVVVFLAFVCAVLWELIRILREVRGVVSNLNAGSEALTRDLSKIHKHVKTAVVRVGQKISAGIRKKKSR